MNERIQELAEQSEITQYVAAHNKYLEWFAELIVRECQFAIVSRTDLPTYERKLYNNVLKQHFGVEE